MNSNGHQRTLQPVLSSLAYSVCSLAMTMLNKSIFAIYAFPDPALLIFLQNVWTVIGLLVGRRLGWFNFELPTLRRLIQVVPLNLCFLGMLISGSYALAELSVPMVSVLKNLSLVITLVVEARLFGQPISPLVALSVSLMLFSPLLAAKNDLAFSRAGYLWQTLNILLSSLYPLWARRLTADNSSLIGLMFANNLLGTLILSFYVPFANRDWLYLSWPQAPVLLSTLSVGFSLSFVSFWCIDSTSATTYSVVGSLNKIPLTLAANWLFGSSLTNLGMAGVAVGLASGVTYTWAKAKAATGKKQPRLEV